MGALKVMGKVGHWELRWSPLTEDQKLQYGTEEFVEEYGGLDEVLATAQERFEEEVDLGGTAFAKNPETGEFDVQVKEFDPDLEVIIVPRIAGG